MNEKVLTPNPCRRLTIAALMPIVFLALSAAAAAQINSAQANSLHAGDDKSAAATAGSARLSDDADPYFKRIYREFYEEYRIGPADKLAVRVVGQPEYSLEKVEVSPVGRIYHPLVGDIDIAGLRIEQVREKLTLSLAEFIRDPKVSVALIEAGSAKIGVLGDVTHPGIVLMARPMTVFDAISAVGGFTDFGSQANVTLLRQGVDGTMRTFKVNVKRVMQGKANAEEDPMLQAGDTIIVHGNFKKTLSTITALAGFGSFVRIISGQ